MFDKEAVIIKSHHRPITLSVGAWLGFILIYAFFDSYEWMMVNQKYAYGDWLINYQGGFVRRGFLGEVAFRIGGLVSINPKWIVLMFHLSAYSTFFFGFLYALVKKNILTKYIFLVISPFIFQFQFNDVGGGFRKEILYFVILSVNLMGAVYEGGKYKKKLFFLSLSVYPLLILAHELLVIYLPVVLILGKEYIFKSKRYILSVVGLLILNCGSVILMVLYKGDAATIEKICASLVDFCSSELDKNGSISWLARDAIDGVRLVRYLYSNVYNLFYLFMSVVCVGIPFFCARSQIYDIYKDVFSRLMLMSVFAGTFLLSIVAIDYGRFLYILAVSLFALIIGCDKTSNEQQVLKLNCYTVFMSFLLLVYCFSVRLPHVPNSDMGSRYFKYLFNL